MARQQSPNPSAGDRRADVSAAGAYCSVSQAAALLGVSRVTLSRWIRVDQLPAARLGHRTVRINRADVERLLTGRASAGGQSADRDEMTIVTPATHAVQLYASDSFLLEAVTDFLAEALHDGRAALVVATPEHRAGIERSLAEAGLDLPAARAEGRYLDLDAAETLAQFMVAELPDARRFEEVVGGIIRQASGERPLHVFGEMVALLAAADNHDGALRLEEQWNGLQERRGCAFSLLCAYPLQVFDSTMGGDQFDAICDTHTHVVPAESYAALDSADGRLRMIAALQQKAARLEAEIAERQRIEQRLREEHQLSDTLYRIGSVITAELDLTTTVQTVTDEATSVLGAAFGAFFYNVSDERGETYQLYTLSGAPREAFSCFPMPRNTAVFGPTFRGEAVVRLDDVTRDPRHGQNPPYFGTPPGHLPVRSYLAVPVISRGGEVLGGLFFGHPEAGVFSERTERIATGIAMQAATALDNAHLYRQAQQARDAAQQAAHLRDEFLGSISHDLRTPLTTITGLSQLLLRQADRAPSLDSGRVTQALAQIAASATRMAGMIDELLDLTRLESGRPLELNRAPADALAQIRTLVEQHQRGTAQHDLRLITDLTALPVCWDSTRLERALSNLLSNAIKYSPEGSAISVHVAREERTGQPWLRLVVADNGLGIPAADLPHIFERFHRAENVRERIKGIGIGLAGAKQIIEQHGGAISVESTEGAGTRVTVCLPCAPEEDDR